MIHKVQLCKNANCSPAQWIDMASELECFRIDDIDVGRGNGKDDAVWFCDILCDEVSGLLFDIGWLVANRNLRKFVSKSFSNALSRQTFVKPGKSIRVKFRTCGEKIFRLMGCRF